MDSKPAQEKLKTDFFSFIEKINQFADYITNKKYWKISASLALVLMSYMLSFPDYNHQEAEQEVIDNFLSWQFEHPFEKYPYIDQSISDVNNSGLVSHLNKRWIRLTVPMISKALHLTPPMWLFIMPAMSVVFMLLLLSTFEQLLKDKRNALLAGFGFAFTFQVHWFFFDDKCYDCIAWTLLLIAFYYKRNPFVFIFVALLALYTDERAGLGLAMIQLYNYYTLNEGRLFPIINIKKAVFNTTLYFLVPVLLYLSGRWLLLHYTTLVAGYTSVGLNVFLYNYKFIPASFWVNWEGVSLLFLLACWIIKNTENKLVFFFFLMTILAIHLSCFIVYDISRSIGYYYPLIFLSLYILHQHLDYKKLNMVLIVTSFISFVVPSHVVKIDGIYWLSPAFPKIMKLLM